MTTKRRLEGRRRPDPKPKKSKRPAPRWRAEQLPLPRGFETDRSHAEWERENVE